MKRLLSLVAVLMVLLVGAVALDTNTSSNFTTEFGTYVYAAQQKVFLDYDGCYYGEIGKYSDISGSSPTKTLVFIIEKPNIGFIYGADYNTSYHLVTGKNASLLSGDEIDTSLESGNITAILKIHHGDINRPGTVVETYTETKFYNFTGNAEPITLTADLLRGYEYLLTVCRTTMETNITRLQLVRLDYTPAVEIKEYPQTGQMVDYFGQIIAFEVNVVSALYGIFQLGTYFFYIVIMPVLLVLGIMWAFRKVKEAVLK